MDLYEFSTRCRQSHFSIHCLADGGEPHLYQMDIQADSALALVDTFFSNAMSYVSGSLGFMNLMFKKELLI